jgi:hypothetical protein
MQPKRPNVWWWFLVPLFTCGLGSFVMVLVGGLWLKSKAHIAAAIGYFLLTVYFFVATDYSTTNHGPIPDAAITPAFLAIWLGGLGHTLFLQLKIREGSPVAPPPSTDPALAAAQWRLHRRAEARAILAGNPALAAELRIGRPDLTRQYDDGGLVDVNHVPAAALISHLDVPAHVATQIVAERDRIGGFSSPDELVVYCQDMTAERLEIVRDRLAFIPL